MAVTRVGQPTDTAWSFFIGICKGTTAGLRGPRLQLKELGLLSPRFSCDFRQVNLLSELFKPVN